MWMMIDLSHQTVNHQFLSVYFHVQAAAKDALLHWDHPFKAR